MSILSPLKTNIAKQTVGMLSSPSVASYVYAADGGPWDDDNNAPPANTSIVSTNNDLYERLSFGKRIKASDVVLSTKRYNWVSGTVYPFYDGTRADLSEQRFYVCSAYGGSLQVFKCLNNNGGVPSTVQPLLSLTTEQESSFTTSDGYVWKYLFTISSTDLLKFATSNTIPVLPNANVASAAVPGAIPVIQVVSGGESYNNYAEGVFQQIAPGGNTLIYTLPSTLSANSDFYKGSTLTVTQGIGAGQQAVISEYLVSGGFKRVVLDRALAPIPDLNSRFSITPRIIIDGDGEGATAVVNINPNGNTIQRVDMLTPGKNYTYANLTVVGNTGIATLAGSTSPSNPAVLRAILAPPKGHGADVEQELGASLVTLSVEFDGTEDGTITNNTTIRNYGIVKDPRYSSATFTVANTQGLFAINEPLLYNQTPIGKISNTNVLQSTITIEDVLPIIPSGNVVVVGQQSNASARITQITISGQQKDFDTFDQHVKLAISMNLAASPFNVGDVVTQETTLARGVVRFANSSFVALNQVRGTFLPDDINQQYPLSGPELKTASITSVVSGDLKKLSGEQLYTINTPSVLRTAGSKQAIKVTIEV